MGWILAFVGSKVGRLVGIVLGVLALIGGVFLAGQQTEKKNQKIKELKEFKDTKERIDEVDPAGNLDDAIDRLRDNDQLR